MSQRDPYYKDSRSGRLGDREYNALARIVGFLLCIAAVGLLILCVVTVLLQG